MRIISAIKIIWRLIVDISNIISCGFTILSCYIAYTAVSEIISLNVEIAPIVKEFRRDSVIIEKNIISEQPSIVLDKQKSEIYKDPESENSEDLSDSEVDTIISHREEFLKRMRKLFKKISL